MSNKKEVKATDVLKNFEPQKDIEIVFGEGDAKTVVLVKSRLSLLERGRLVSDIADMVFRDDEGAGEIYTPYTFGFAVGFNLINYFTNVKIPTDIEKAWEFISVTKLGERVAEVVPDCYVNDIIRDARELIAYKVRKLTNKSKLDNVLDSIVGLIKEFSGKLDGVTGENLVEQLVAQFPEFKEKLPTILEEKE